MKIAILGTGNIGSTLANKWVAAGHEIIFGTRDPQSSKVHVLLDALGGDCRAAGLAEAIDAGEVVLFAIPWAAVPETARENAAGLDGKILIDATNNFGGPVINNLAALQQNAPNAQIYRAFNSLGWEIFAAPEIQGHQADLFYSGPEGVARQKVERLIAEVGLRPIRVGDNERVKIVDHIGALWVSLAFQQGWGRGIALKLLVK